MKLLLNWAVSVILQACLTGFASEVSEGSLYPCIYPWKDPKSVLMVVKTICLLINTEVSKLVVKGTGDCQKLRFGGNDNFSRLFLSAVVLNLPLTVSHSQYKSDKSVPEVVIQRSKVITKLIVTNSLRQIPANFKWQTT